MTILVALLAAALAQPAPVSVLARDVAAGEALAPGDFRPADGTGSPIQRGALQPAEAAGMEALRRLPAGAVVRRTDLRTPQQVKRGDAVTITFNSGVLMIATQGRALTGGGSGETVRVVSASTHHTLEAIVDGPRRVRILND
jgi:flagella basal body P-ring formation protein FlgA